MRRSTNSPRISPPPRSTARTQAFYTPQPVLEVGTILAGRYEIVQTLGEGGMGVVHLGLDRHGRAVAIKVLRPHVAYDPEARWRLEREVDTAHP